MINIRRFVFMANCYVVSDDTGECVIIDPCAQYRRQREHFKHYISKEQLRPVRCLLTHGHYDHLLSCDQIKEEYGLFPEIHHGDKPWMARVQTRIEEVFGPGVFQHEIVQPQRFLEDDEVITFGNHSLRLIHTPGHSPGSAVFYCEEEKAAFTGDILFKGDIGRSDLLFSWPMDLEESLEKLTQLLPDDCVIWPGHGFESTMGYEKWNNEFLSFSDYGL